MENLFDYQAQAIEDIVFHNGRCILHADAGVGKTAIAVKYAANYALGHTLFLCPTICKKQVEAEAKRFTELKPLIIDGNANSREFAWSSVNSSEEKLLVIVNYESLVVDVDLLQKLTKQGLTFDCIIVDECQKGANPQNKFVKIIKKMWNVRLRIAMSGTPITNELHEYWSMIDWCEPGILGKSFFQFKTDWCIMSPYIPGKIMGYRKETLLRETFSSFIIRIKREDVLLDLPDLHELEDKDKLNFNEQLTYDKLKKDLILEINNSETITVSSVLASIIKLRQLVDCPQSLGFDFIGSKLHRAKVLLDAWLEEDRENKIIVFSELKPPLLFLAAKYENSGLITGDVSQKNREEVLENFRTRPECRILFCSSAGATGVNMQSANKILNYGLPWTYSKLEQRTARAWRQGQERPVESRILIAEDTIDEHMLRLVRRKEKLTKNDLLDILES